MTSFRRVSKYNRSNRLFIFAKAVLRSPSRGGKRKRYVVCSILQSRLLRWQSGDSISLWEDARREASQNCRFNHGRSPPLSRVNARRSIFLAREGRYGDAVRALAGAPLTALYKNHGKVYRSREGSCRPPQIFRLLCSTLPSSAMHSVT
jgi:hypothetical protein